MFNIFGPGEWGCVGTDTCPICYLYFFLSSLSHTFIPIGAVLKVLILCNVHVALIKLEKMLHETIQAGIFVIANNKN